jgi:integrase
MDVRAKSRRARGDGSYRRRKDSWELKFNATDPKTGIRATRFVTFKGTETGARAKLRELLKQADDGAFIAPARQTYGEVLDAWEAGLTVSAKTAERYKELVKLHIRPHLGALKLSALRTSRIETFYRDLRAGVSPTGASVSPLAARTIGHIHRIVVQSLSVAERDGAIPSNPARIAKRPKIERQEIEILTDAQIKELLQKLRGHSYYSIAALGLATGMRRGELLALRWKDVDLEGAHVRVEQSLEQTNDGLRFKEPKTRHGRRRISLPAALVTELRGHRKAQQEERLKLGLGREPEEGLVFRRLEPRTGTFTPIPPDSASSDWRRIVVVKKLPKVSMHAWRHTHASQLIAAGLDVLSISRRLGHGTPSITLDVYGHLFKRQDDGAAAVFDAAFGADMAGTDADESGTAANEVGGK